MSRSTASGSIAELKALVVSHPELLLGKKMAAGVEEAVKARAADRDRIRLDSPE